MTDDLTAQPSEQAGAGAGAAAPAAPPPGTPGAPETQQPPPAQEPEEGQAPEGQEEGAAPAAPPSPPSPPPAPPEPAAPAVDVEALRAERERRTREFDTSMGELNLEYQQTADNEKRAELARKMGALEAEYKADYMASFAKEHGVELNDPEVDRAAPNQASFEASVLRAANARLRQKAEQAQKQLEELQRDLPATVAAEVQRQLTTAGVNRVDAGAGQAGAPVTDWTQATPEQVARMQAEIDARR